MSINKLQVLPNRSDSESPWYKDGLPFECTQCGQCCTGAPGYTWIDDKEIVAIAEFLKITLKDFGMKYLRKAFGKWALKEHSKTYDCVFLKDNKCSVYPVRPKQCRTFPWWVENLKSREAWEETAKRCEGIHNEASLVSFEDIQRQL